MDSTISKLSSLRDLGSLQTVAPTPLHYQMYSMSMSMDDYRS